MLIQPMEPVLSNTINEGEEWVHQIKWDGIRGITYISNGQLKLFTKKGIERTEFYPEVQELLLLFDGFEGILDGELVCFDTHKPSFANILTRERVRNKKNLNKYLKQYPVKYILFDIMSHNNVSLLDQTLRERIDLLKSVIEKSPTITVTDNFTDGYALFELMREKHYEGIVCKNLNSKYIGGKSHQAWYKVKLNHKLLTVVGGIQLKNGYPNALLVGIYREGKFEHIGTVASGLKSDDFEIIYKAKDKISLETCPFDDTFDKEAIWVEPKLTCWVHFMEWTESGRLRHPVIKGFSHLPPEEAIGVVYDDERNP